MAKKPTTTKNERATAIADKIAEQVRTLITRDWDKISEVLDEDQGGDGEIKLSFGTIIRDRAAMPGEQADKDNQLKTTMSFSTKFSDAIESKIPDPTQPDLPGTKNPTDAPI